MRLKHHLSLPGRVDAVTFDESGGRLAVATAPADAPAHQVAKGEPGYHLHVYQFVGGGFVCHKVMTALDYGAAARSGRETRWKFLATRVACRDEKTLLTLRSAREQPAQHKRWREMTELIGIDLETGEEVGCHELSSCDYYPNLVALSRSHALVGRAKTAACVDVATFCEVWQAQMVGERGGSLGVHDDPDENAAPGGYVYDSATGQLWVLSGQFNEAFLQCYRLGPGNHSLGRLWRRSVLEGHYPAGLCVNPDGSGVTASFQIMDELADLVGRPVVDWTLAREELIARRLELAADPPPPRTARLGCLVLYKGSDVRQFDIYSEVARDFTCSPQTTPISADRLVVVGYRLAAGSAIAGGDFMTKPVFVGDRHLVVGTPSGLLRLIDAESGESEEVHDFGSPIRGVEFCPRTRQLVVGCDDGTLAVLAADDAP
jgi:hypothetical protein